VGAVACPSADEAVRIAVRAARGLDALHKRGVRPRRESGPGRSCSTPTVRHCSSRSRRRRPQRAAPGGAGRRRPDAGERRPTTSPRSRSRASRGRSTVGRSRVGHRHGARERTGPAAADGCDARQMLRMAGRADRHELAR
jgi:hypothetical protein